MRELARRRIEADGDRLDTHLCAHGPYLFGADHSVLDLCTAMLMRWSCSMPKPADRWPAIAALAQRIKARASWKRVCAIERLAKWV